MSSAGATSAGIDHLEVPNVVVNGESLPLIQLVAIAESLEQERPNLFGFLKSFHSSSLEEMRLLFRQMIRDDYHYHALEAASAPPTSQSPSSPPVIEEKDGKSEEIRACEELDFGMVVVDFVPSAPEAGKEVTLLEEKEQSEVRELAARLAEVDLEEELRKGRFFHCAVCMDSEASIHGAITLDCNHRFCEDCLSGFLVSQIESNKVGEDELCCPREDCCCSIQHATIRHCTETLGHPEVYEKYLAFTTDQYLQREIRAGGALRCPSERCNYVFQTEWRPGSGTSFAFQCEKCRSQFCLNCSLVRGVGGGRGVGPGHAPLSCAQQEQKMREEDAERLRFEEWKSLNDDAGRLFDQMVLDSGWKRCPSCECVIERTAGCDHMTCKACKCNFCFVCGKHNAEAPSRRGDCGTTCPSRR